MAVGVFEEGSSPSLGPRDLEHHTKDVLYSRTSWADATVAISHINKGRAKGNRAALWVRKCLQDQLYQLGQFSEGHAGKIVFVALLILATFCVALKSATMVTDIEKLWIEEGGRLEKELDYVTSTLGEGSGTTNQILIQLPHPTKLSILTPQALRGHLRVLLEATKVTVDMFDITWSLNDLCYANSFPYFHNHLIDQIFEKLTPCAIVTPLDCFWEGSKLLGPEFPVTIPGYGERVRWTNLNPQKILDKMGQIENSRNFFPFSAFSDFMKRSGISTAYLQKPCLDPEDEECPDTAPNKKSKKAPDVGAELTGGCYGFAGKYLHWPEELIVGGVKKNRTGHIVSGEALQSIVQLMGSKNLFDHWRDHYKVHNMEWTQQNAALILDAWLKKFAKRVSESSEKLSEEGFNLGSFLPFASNALLSLVSEFSAVSICSTSVSGLLTVIYVCLSFFRSGFPQDSSCGLAVAGVVLIISSVAAGLGLCTLLGLPLTAVTTQVLPFLTLGLGVGPIFVILNTVPEVCFSENLHKNGGTQKSHVGEVLKRCGASVLVTSVCKVSSFLAAAVIPVMAVRVFCIQASIVVAVSALAILMVFPALLSLDLRRRNASRADILCCFPTTLFFSEVSPTVYSSPSSWLSSNAQKKAENRDSSTNGVPIHVLCEPFPEDRWVGVKEHPNQSNLSTDEVSNTIVCSCSHLKSPESLVKQYSRWIRRGSVRGFVVLFFFLSVAASIWGISRLEDGLDMTDIVPSGSPELAFLEAQQTYFGFYNMFAVTQGDFEYPTQQKLLHEYHESFTRIPWIIKNDDGGLPDSWLILFRDWLIGLQREFDSDWKLGLVTEEGWGVNASDQSVLAYKLLAQTGHVDHPVDRSLVSKVRLVDSEGIINPKAFYNYLTAWVTNDALAYSASLANLRPIPRTWVHERSDYDLKIPKSPRLTYGQFPFYVSDLHSTPIVTEMIEAVRQVCRKFQKKGLPNFPIGVPFTFWEQYIHLRFFLALALLVALSSVFVVHFLVFMSLWTAMFAMLLLSAVVLQAAGLLGLIGFKMSALPAALLVILVGAGSEPFAHVFVGFLTNIGDRRRRANNSVEVFGVTTFHTAISIAVAALPLVLMEWTFVRWYVLLALLGLAGLMILNSLLFLPIILSIAGPPALLSPANKSDHGFPPPTPPSRAQSDPETGTCHSRDRSIRGAPNKRLQGGSARRSYQGGPLRNSNLSLTTITEEDSASSHSGSATPRTSTHEILVEPRVVIETTTYEQPDLPQDGFQCPQHVTTVTATAKVKVELHNKPSDKTSKGCRGDPRNVASSRSSFSTTNSTSTCGKSAEEDD